MNLFEVLVRPVRPLEEQRFQHLIQEHHYLGALPKISETLWYAATSGDQWVALLSFSSAALKCSVRGRWIGWDFRHQYDLLKLLTNNSWLPLTRLEQIYRVWGRDSFNLRRHPRPKGKRQKAKVWMFPHGRFTKTLAGFNGQLSLQHVNAAKTSARHPARHGRLAAAVSSIRLTLHRLGVSCRSSGSSSASSARILHASTKRSISSLD